MIKGARERALEKISYRYWLKDKNRSAENNWRLAEKLLNYIDKRIILVERILNGK